MEYDDEEPSAWNDDDPPEDGIDDADHEFDEGGEKETFVDEDHEW